MSAAVLHPLRLTQGVFAQWVAYPLAMRSEGRDITAKERWLRAEMALPAQERLARSRKSLSQRVSFAGAHVPYYRDLFARLGFNPERLEQEPAYLEELPYLTKDIIREQGDRMLREDRAGLRDHHCRTGGSTGVSAVIHYDQEAADWSSAVTHYCRRRIGKRHFMRETHFASRFPEKFPLKDRLREYAKCLAMNRTNLFFDDLSPESLDEMWRRLRRARPHLVHAHPSTIYQLAQHVDDRYGSARAFDIFESSGETLEPYQRGVIERALNCRVVDRYGLAEYGVVAYQFDGSRNGLQVLDPIAWPEVAPLSEDAVLRDPKGQVGELVLTALKNDMMPLIRYRTGDIVDLGREERGFVFHDVLGRIHDLVTLGDRAYATHFVQDVLDRLGTVREFQIDMTGSEPVLCLVLEPEAGEVAVAARVRELLGEETKIRFISPAEIRLQGARAKFRHVVTQ